MSSPFSESTYAAEIADRMREICADLSFSEVARRTHTNRETARRYMTHGRASAEFVARLCEAFDVSGTWLLTGRGPKLDLPGGRGGVHTRGRGGAFLDGRSSRSRRGVLAS